VSNANANQNDNTTIGKYKLVNCLASGQHSQVWEVTDSETTRRVALKLLLPQALTDPEQVSTLKYEFKVGTSFDHPNIIKYYELVSNKKHCFFAMELFAAPNLKTQVFNDPKGVHVRFKRLVEQVALALEHIHERGWVHRDIKPDNILMNKSAEVRVVDFSLSSRAAGALSKVFARKQSVVKGTRTYMAPEQIMGKPLTPQTDIYNFGVTLFELLTGQAPFAGSTPKDLLLRHIGEQPPNPCDLNTNITPEMGMIILRMLSKKPEQRQKKMSEFTVEFRNVKVFKEEIVEGELTEEQKAEAALGEVLGERLDSRTDALRTKMGIAAPEKKKKPAPKPPASRPAAPAPAAPQPMAPGGMPQMMQYPMMPYPMQPMMPQPMMPQMPGMPMPGGPMQMPQMPMNPSASQMPWVAAPQAPGTAPWGAPPAPAATPGPAAPRPASPSAPAAAAPGAVAPRPAPPPVPASAIPVAPAAARPAPPPVAPTAVPKVAPRPAAPVAAPPRPAPAKPKAPPPASKPEETFKIDDLLGFDELPPAV